MPGMVSISLISLALPHGMRVGTKLYRIRREGGLCPVRPQGRITSLRNDMASTDFARDFGG